MNHLTPVEKLTHGIARMQEVWTLAKEAAPIAPPPACETLGLILNLTTEALLILKNLRGQIGGSP